MKKKTILVVVGVVVVLCIALFALGFATMDTPEGKATSTAQKALTHTQVSIPTITPTVPSITDKAQNYFDEYGGKFVVYTEILSLTDCDVLQENFDIASSNNARATPGTREFKWTLGYMAAADDRMTEIGCYE